ncbi:hypothetical protein CRE_29423 [Caenorhabditis remanei]|uniref:Domain of unknown function WSN domain-containing protein n=1 Tax=Caenorhabditis remanei TaxID=31234 RepID=E3LUX3_CAERE|nr:hypothetical protein CRE_29423 [Caenorhabditis remanei]
MIRLIPFVVWIGAILVNGHPPGNLTRFSRASDAELTTSLKQMQMLARITNGIYLQQGMIKGTIPPADLVSELLNLEAVKLTEIQNLDVGKLEGVAKNIDELPGKLKTNDGVVNLENRLALLRSIIDLSNGVASLAAPDASFKTEVDTLKDIDGIEWDNFRKYSEGLHSFLSNRKKIEQGIPVKDKKAHEDVLQQVRKAADDLKLDLTQNYVNLKSDAITTAEGTFLNWFSIRRSMAEWNKNDKVMKYSKPDDDNNINFVGENIKNMGEVIGEVKKENLKFNTLEHVFDSRIHRSGSRDLKHTPAFSEGPSDIGLISKDFENGWIQSVVGKEYPKLAAALKSLETIQKLTEDVENSLGSPSKDTLKSISEVVNSITGASQLTVSFDDLASKLKDVQESISASNIIPAQWDTYNTLIEHVSSLFDQITAADAVVELSKETITEDMKKNLEHIRNITDPTHKDDPVAVLEKLDSFSDKLADTSSLVTALNTTNQAQPVKDSASQISKNFNELNNYVTNSKKFLDVLAQLRGIGGFESIEPVIKLRRKLSQLTKNKGNLDCPSLVQNIGKMQPKLKALEAEITKLKGMRNGETGALMYLNYAKKDSDTLGSATRGIASMQQMTKDPVDIKQLADAVGTIDSERKTSLVKLSAEEEKSLDELSRLEDDINSLKYIINVYILYLKISKSEKLSDHADIFDRAASVNGISTDFKTAIVLIEKLANDPFSLASDDLRKSVPIWEKLDSIGLDFAKYQTDFQSAKKSLSSLEATFSKLHRSFALTASSPSNSSESESLDDVFEIRYS